MPEVSVIMATYNCDSTLRRAIDSILNQTYTDWEFVICDDCSTDETYSILQDYKKIYPEKFVIVRNDKNSKLPFSLNHCLSKATGKYIARMDGDDISAPTRLEKQKAYLDRHPEYMVVGTNMRRFDESGEYSIYHAVKSPNVYTLYTQVPFCHATIMMRSEAYSALGGYTVADRTERGQDVDLWFRFFKKGYTGNNINEELYYVCEDRNAIRRRKLKYSWHMTMTRFLGFRLNHFPLKKYYLIPLPLVSYCIPRWVKMLVRKRKK